MSRLGRPGPQDLNALCLPPTAPPTDSPARLGPRTTDFPGWLIGVDWNEGPGYMGISLDGLSHRAALPAVNNSAWRAFPRKPGARPLLVAGEMQRDMVPLRVSIHHDRAREVARQPRWALVMEYRVRGGNGCGRGALSSARLAPSAPPAPKPAGRACNGKASRVHRVEGLALNQVCLDCCSVPVQMLCGGRRRAQGASLRHVTLRVGGVLVAC